VMEAEAKQKPLDLPSAAEFDSRLVSILVSARRKPKGKQKQPEKHKFFNGGGDEGKRFQRARATRAAALTLREAEEEEESREGYAGTSRHGGLVLPPIGKDSSVEESPNGSTTSARPPAPYSTSVDVVYTPRQRWKWDRVRRRKVLVMPDPPRFPEQSQIQPARDYSPRRRPAAAVS